MHKSILRGSTVLILIICFTLIPIACSRSDEVKIFPQLKGLGLTGKLVFILVRQQGNQLVELDLAAGKLSSIFDVPDRAYIGGAAVSPDGTQIMMSYSPPSPSNTNRFGVTDLYVLDVNGIPGVPQRLTYHGEETEVYTQPVWSPDGQYLYYTHLIPTSGALGSVSQIERMKIPDGKSLVVFQKAVWASLSPDGSKMAYLTAGGLGINQLYLGNSDGSGSHPALSLGQFPFVDAHFFTPDGKAIVFSASSQIDLRSNLEELEAPILDWNLGVKPVEAHPQPSDWYILTLADGHIQRMAQVQDINLYGAFSPDGRWIGFISQQGVFVMKPDGTALTQIASLFGTGGLSWVK